jgi:hypothetical protein
VGERQGRGWIGDDKRTWGTSRANELMPFRLAVWRKLGCLKMTRSSWRFNIMLDVACDRSPVGRIARRVRRV